MVAVDARPIIAAAVSRSTRSASLSTSAWWDPPWDPSMMDDTAASALGFRIM
ncbi:MAG: hypothetical protein JO345_20545 [Streptosporangiaceae bacterium]|nr:hypothetical protein [Streptosporangiaceae bacterium]